MLITGLTRSSRLSSYLAHLTPVRTHLTPEISLRLLDKNSTLYTGKANLESDSDPFWALYWPGGQGLARYILDRPSLVKGKKVLDLGAGCGACSIACALGKASSIVANDIDPLALDSVSLNAELNGIKDIILSNKNYLDPMTDASDLNGFDIILAGDMLFDDLLGSRLTTVVKKLEDTIEVFVGDPGRWVMKDKHFNLNLETIAKYELDDETKLENYGFQNTLVFKVSKNADS